MAYGTKLFGVATLACAFSTSVQAETLARANAFACGVDSAGLHSSVSPRAARAAYRGYGSAGMDPQMPSTVKLRIVYEYPDRIEVDHCGGTVVDSRWIVTAAHCVAADSTWDRVEVIAGDTNLDGSGAVRRVSRDAVCHSGFDYTALTDDVALIRLDDPLPPHIPPAQLDQQNMSSARRGSSAMVAGWPVTGLKAGDRRLNKTSVQLTDVQVPGYITAVSATGGAEGVCRGESGGPLMSYGPYGMTLAGVLSGIQPGTENGMGDECMLSGYEMYFTPIAAFRNWLDSVRGLCTRNPALCSGSGSRGALLAKAPSYDGSSKKADPMSGAGQAYVSAAPIYQPVSAQPLYTPVATQPAYAPSVPQTTYAQIQTQPVYTPVAAMPVYANAEPSYVEVSLPQQSYAAVNDHATYIDISNQYVADTSVYSVATAPVYPVATTPVYQDTGYSFSIEQPITVTQSQPVYLDVGSIDLGSAYSPPAVHYQQQGWQSQTPVYMNATPQYDHVGSYDGSGFSVAYVDQFSGVSTYQPHAW